MKSRSAIRWGRFLIAVALPFAAGCVQDAVSSNEPVTNSAVVGAVTNVTVTNAAVETDAVVPTAEEPMPDISTADVKPIPGEKPLPHNIRSNSPVADIMKLADSGVDQSVMLAFVTNSTSTFNLTADDIIYLKDIGISGVVISSILEHDRNLQSALITNTWQSQTPPPTETAAPPPEEMAPQVAQEPPPAQETAPPPSQVTYNNFYSSLSPYGTWVEVDGYGRCWQPTVVAVNPTWQPYSDCGRWVYTDYGWYWASEYSWGWAPFHYGRWFRHYRLGWCWYPDTIWGPSWVTWRYTDAYCGWAPLPPCAWYSSGIGLTYWGSHVGVSFTFGLGYGSYCFVSWNNFCGSHPHDHVVHHGYNKQIYDRSVVATRISGARNNVFNHGVPVERVERATGTTLNRVAVHEVTSPRAGGLRPERLSSDGRSLTVYRPRMPEGKREMPPVVKERVQPGQRPAYVAGGSSGQNLESRIVRPGASSAGAASQSTGTRPDQVTRPASSVSRSASSTPSRLAEVTERDLTPQRPIPAASLDRSSKSARLPEGWGRAQDRDPSASSSVRPGSQSNPGASTRAELSQPARNVETARPNSSTTQRSPAVPQYRTQPQQQQQQNVQVPRYTPAPNTVYQQPRPSAQTPQYSPTPRTEVPRYTAPAPTYQSPAPRTYTAPQPAQPTYQAPRTATPEVPRYNPAPQREYRAETPRYTAPAPAPERSYTAPQPSQPAQPRSSSPPAQSSGGNSGNSNTRGDRQSR